MSKKIAVILGSYSLASYAPQLAHYLKQHAPQDIELNIADFSQLPLYDRDLPILEIPACANAHQVIADSDGVLFVFPEHNNGVPAIIKNVIDIVSAPQGKWKDKPAGIVTISDETLGGMNAEQQLRVFASNPFIHLFVAPASLNITAESSLFDEKGDITSPILAQKIQAFLQQYAQFALKFS